MREWWIEIFYTKGGLTFGSPGYTREGELALTFSQPPKVKHKNSVELINVIEKAAYLDLKADLVGVKIGALILGTNLELAEKECSLLKVELGPVHRGLATIITNELLEDLKARSAKAQKLVDALEKIALEPPGCDSAWFAKEALAEWKAK